LVKNDTRWSPSPATGQLSELLPTSKSNLHQMITLEDSLKKGVITRKMSRDSLATVSKTE
jgi:hypothetical protein